MTYLRSLLLGLGIIVAVAAFRPLAASASPKPADALEGRVMLVSSAVSSSRPSETPAFVLALVVGSDIITVNLAEDVVVVGADGQPSAASKLRANDIIQMRGEWQSLDRFRASWLQRSAT